MELKWLGNGAELKSRGGGARILLELFVRLLNISRFHSLFSIQVHGPYIEVRMYSMHVACLLCLGS